MPEPDEHTARVWAVEYSEDGLAWQAIRPGGPFTYAEALVVVRSCQSAHDVLEWTCGAAPGTWRLRNVATGAFSVGETPDEPR